MFDKFRSDYQYKEILMAAYKIISERDFKKQQFRESKKTETMLQDIMEQQKILKEMLEQVKEIRTSQA